MSPDAKPREVARQQPLVNRERSAQDLARVVGPSGIDVAPAGRFVQRALEHLRNIPGAEGLPAEFVADPVARTTSSGAVSVNLRQQFKSIPIFLGAQTVRFKPNGEVESAVGAAFTIDTDTPVDPTLGAAQAAVQAAKHVADLGQGLLGEVDPLGQTLDAPSVDVSHFQPKVLSVFPDMPNKPTVLEAGPFGAPIRADLLWYPAVTGLRLAWQVMIVMPQGAGQYRVIVDAKNGETLYSRQLVQMLEARGNVYRADGTARQMTSFPRAWADYGVTVPTWDTGFPGQPDHWLDGPNSVGNSVNAHLGDSGGPINAVPGGAGVVFDPSDPAGDDQKVLNIFYYNNVMHDVFYLLGFREADGNFQQDTKGRGGIPGDPVDARAHSQAVWGTANMLTPVDGTSPTMNMGLVMDTGLHTAFDSTVVFHEYMHGVTNRLVGGAMNDHALEEPQSRAMGEGWGDYVACTLNNVVTVGHWVKRKPGGIRSAPYDDNYPGRFGDIGTGIYTEIHRVGEIWCAALVQMNRNLDARLGAPRGRNLALQLVVDALKLSPANPNMLDMRNAILKALDHKRGITTPAGLSEADYGVAKTEVWRAFAKYGMGTQARSGGANLSSVVGDTTMPNGGTVVTPPVVPPPVVTPPVVTPPVVTPPTGTSAGTIQLSDPAGIGIPDNNASGLARTLTVSQAGSIRRVTVHVDIQHDYPGDLDILLLPPSGGAVTLYNRAFSPPPTLTHDYTSDDTPALAALSGKSPQGAWTLKVADHAEGDTGTLRSWGLDVELAQALSGPSAFDSGDVGFSPNKLNQGLTRVQDLMRQIIAVLDALRT